MKKELFGNLDGDKIIVTDNNTKSLLIAKGYGEKHDSFLVLDIYETFYLKEKQGLKIKSNNRNISIEKIIEIAIKDKKEFLSRYAVYKDLRSKGYVVKTGLKFGFDFRVYPKGKKIDDAHTQYVIDVITQNSKISTSQISKSVRMSIGLHTNSVYAIVDNELEISYFSINRLKV